MPGPWSRSSEWAEVVATRSRMAKAASRAGEMGAWLGRAFCTGGTGAELEERGRPVDFACGPVDLFKMLTGVELEVAGELDAGHAGFALELNFVEREDGVVSGADVKLGGRGVKLIGVKN
jgi:hypothetical protein